MTEEKEFKMVSTSWMLPGVYCWILQQSEGKQDENAYIRGTIIALTANRLHARMTYPEERGPEEVPVQFIAEANQDYENYKQGWEDMVQMNVLNEAEIIANIKLRYSRDLIFTFIGPTLIVMNPYKRIEGAFTGDTLQRYQKQLFASESFDMRHCEPHVYAISAQAYSQMFTTQKNQAIVISGESGAGKTENAKYAMKFLTSLSAYQGGEVVEGEVPIEDKILSCNPILEAFGNSKTVRNDNSSRFGKYVRMWVVKSSRKIIGASVQNYLLEKSRVTQLAQGERNFHVFYHMLKGLTQAELVALQLCDENLKSFPMNKYDFLNQSACHTVDTIDDKALFQEMMQSFITMKFTAQECDAIFRVIAAVLLLGNLQFDGATLTDSAPCSVKDRLWLGRIATVLQMQEKAIEDAIFLKTREVGKQIIHSPNSLEECHSISISLSRALYDKLFNWLVRKLNQTIIPSQDTSQTLAIGLLDIFGFENFQVNSFEQLCINFTNEKLQSLYIAYVFKSEEHEFIREGLADYLQQLKYTDNQPIIDLIDKYPLSIFDLLDESCTLASATEEQLLQKIAKTYAEHAHFKVPKQVKDKFSIVHTPKEVTYLISGFRAKNKDEISKDLDRGVVSSTNECIVRYWRCQLEGEKYDEAAQRGSTKENKFLSAKFRKQMKDLMEELQSCDVHFIRCIKSNEIKRPDHFLNSYVLLQVRYLGILESVKVRKEGYPIRNDYLGFYARYHELDTINRRITLKRHVAMGSDMKGLVKEIVGRIFPKMDRKVVLYGNTKIYMKMEEGYKLDRLLQEWLKFKGEKATKIKMAFRRHMNRKRINAALKKIHAFFMNLKKLQARIRMKQARRRYLRKKQSIMLAKRYLTKTHHKYLQRNFKKFISQCGHLPKKLFRVALSHEQAPHIPQEQFKQENLVVARLSIVEEVPIFIEHPIEQQNNDDYSEQIKKFGNVIKEFKKDFDIQDEIESMDFKEEEEEEEEKEYADLELSDVDYELATDHFEVSGTRIWSFEQFLIVSPLLSSFLKMHNHRIQAVDLIKNCPKYNELNLAWRKGMVSNPLKKHLNFHSLPLLEMAIYQTKSELFVSKDYDLDFMAEVRKDDYFKFCDITIYKKGLNFKAGDDIQKIMSFDSQYLKQPLLPLSNHFKDALLINRYMLKLAGVKRSRFTKEFLQEQILVLLLGANCVLPLPIPVEAYTSQDYTRKYQSIRFQKEKKVEQLMQGYRAFHYQPTFPKQREDTVVVYKPFLNLVRNKYINNIQEWQKDKQLQNGLPMLRDEAYLQICRLLNDNKGEVVLHFYRFACILSYLVGPTQKTIFAILNFFLNRMENEVDPICQNFSRTIFNNLARQAIQLNVLLHMHDLQKLCPEKLRPSMWGRNYNSVSDDVTFTLRKKLKLYKRDPIDERLARIVTGLDSLYDMCLSAFSITCGRLLLPSWPERIYIQQRKQLTFRISMCNEGIVWVPIDAMNNLRELKITFLQQIGLEKLHQYYSLYQTVEIDGKEMEGFWCNDACKALDLVAKEANDMEIYQEQYKRSIVIKVYLKIRIFYPLRKDDLFTTELLYQQLVQQVCKGELPVGVKKAIELAGLQLYIETQSRVPIMWPTQDQFCERLTLYLAENLINGSWQNAKFKQHKDRQQTFTIQDWSRKILRESSNFLEFKSLDEGKWLYINSLRTEDLFMAQQIKASFHIVPKGNFGLLRRKRFIPGYVGIRPSHIVIVDWPSRQTFKMIPFEEILQWGRAVGTDNLMFVKLKETTETNKTKETKEKKERTKETKGTKETKETKDTIGTTIFFMMGEDGMEQMDYMLHAYLNWEQCLPLDSHLVPSPAAQKPFNSNMFASAANKQSNPLNQNLSFQELDENEVANDNESFSQYNYYEESNVEEFDYQLDSSIYNYDF